MLLCSASMCRKHKIIVYVLWKVNLKICKNSKIAKIVTDYLKSK